MDQLSEFKPRENFLNGDTNLFQTSDAQPPLNVFLFFFFPLFLLFLSSSGEGRKATKAYIENDPSDDLNPPKSPERNLQHKQGNGEILKKK